MRLNVPRLGARELGEVRKVIASGYLTQGSKSAHFEKLVSDYVGVSHAFAVSSATTGLHLALVSLGVKAGDEVVIPDYSFPATANVVEQIGAVPRFLDIDPVTFNLDSNQLESAISEKTKAIMPVHAFGLAAGIDSITVIASKYRLPVVEDAACALTATVGDQQAGSLGDIGVFSFHPRKIITTGEGGMITTSNSEIANKIRLLRSHGGLRGELYLDFFEAGFNYRLSDVNSAIGIAQMQRLEKISRNRRVRAQVLGELLRDIAEVTCPQTPAGARHSFQSYVVMLSPAVDRDQVIREMKLQGIETTLGTYALHLQPFFKSKYDLADSDFPNATAAHRQALTLPLYPQMRRRDLSRIVEGLKHAISQSRRGRRS